MSNLKQAYEEFLVDLVVRELGSLDAVLAAALSSGLTVDAELVAGQLVRVPDSFTVPPSRRLLPHVPARAPVRLTTVLEEQSLIDLATQEYGTVEGLLLLHQLNPLATLLSVPAAGTQLRIDATSAAADPTATVLLRRGVRVATGLIIEADAPAGQFNDSQFNDSQFNV